MPSTVDINRVAFIVMREMRRPLLVLFSVYAVAVFIMTLIPGIVIDGQPYYMSIFHSFYFMTYTATTTGFGEIPYEFSNAQRMWAIVCLYVTVIAWIYAIGAIIRLLQNPYFQQAMAEKKFARSVDLISGPFYLLCGFGDTGSLLARGLSDEGIPAVIIETDEARIKALVLRDYRVPMPGLCADASIPKHLIEAGLQRKNCKAVVAVTGNEEVNLRVSAIARLLNPDIGIITMSKVDIYEETLATLGKNVHIVDPFKAFAKGLTAAIFNPALYSLNEWLVGVRGAPFAGAVCPGRGTWIICGYGRMGHEIHQTLSSKGIPTAVIDPHETTHPERFDKYIVGRTTATTLREAGIESAAGILVATDDDGHNLGILLNARALNPNLFTIVRQNRHENEVAFAAAEANIIMQPSLVTARRILFLMIAELLKPFFRTLMERSSFDEILMTKVTTRLHNTIGEEDPHLVTIYIDDETSRAAVTALDEGKVLLLGHIIRHPGDCDSEIATVPLVVRSGEKTHVLPENNYCIKKNDQILFCGTESAHRVLESTLNNIYSMLYVMTGVHEPRGYFMRWFTKRHFRSTSS